MLELFIWEKMMGHVSYQDYVSHSVQLENTAGI